MRTSTIARVAPGVPTGGQFAGRSHSEPAVTIGGPVGLPESIVDRDTVFTRKFDSVDQRLQALHEELADKVAELATDEGWNHYLDTMAKFHRYSLSNQMLIAIQTKGRASNVAGFNKWKEVGRSVRQGEKGIVILAPRTIRANRTDSSGAPVVDAKGKPVKESKVVGFTTATVFDISQTQGPDLPDGGYTQLSETPPEGLREDLEAAIKESGFTISYKKIPGSERGSTIPATMQVIIDADLTPASQVNTLAHELGHIKAGHLERIDEYHSGHGGQRGAFEIQAESIAYSLLRVNRMSREVGEKSGRYVAGWGKSDPEQVRRSAEHVQKTVKAILGSRSWANYDAETPTTH